MKIFVERYEIIIIVRREDDAYCLQGKDIEEMIRWSIKEFGNSFEDVFDFENAEVPLINIIEDLEKLDEELEGGGFFAWEEVTQEQAHEFIKSLGLM